MSFSTPPVQSSTAPTPLPLNALPTSSTPPEQVTLPSPAIFDILPPLHELLSRLLASENEGEAPAHMNIPRSAPTYQNQQPLSMQQLAGEVSIIRNRIRRARAAVEALPDVDRDIKEQEDEIALLRRTIARQRKVLEGLIERG